MGTCDGRDVKKIKIKFVFNSSSPSVLVVVGLVMTTTTTSLVMMLPQIEDSPTVLTMLALRLSRVL